MSRSNPTLNQPNPSTRWFEWHGLEGKFYYYNKEKKEQVDCGTKLTFILLDQLAIIKGWHERTKSGIVSNEVRDTRSEVMVARCFGGKGGQGYVIATGFYKDIRDRVLVQGGQFTANCYIGYKPAKDQPLALGSVQFKGAALSSWMEFTKQHRKEVYDQAVRVVGFKDGEKGNIKFRTPVFELLEITQATNEEATKLDIKLQEYLKGYLAQTKSSAAAGSAAQADAPGGDAQDDNPFSESEPDHQTTPGNQAGPEEDDVPF